MFIVANEANVSMLRDEKIRVVERQWIVPSPLSVPAVYQSLAASLATHSGWRNQTIALKFRLLSVRVASGASVSNRKMSVMAILRQLRDVPFILSALAMRERPCTSTMPAYLETDYELGETRCDHCWHRNRLIAH